MNPENLTGRLLSIYMGTSGLPEETRQAYIRLWSGQPEPAVTTVLKCIYRGEPTGDWLACPTCIPEKRVRVKIYGCAIHSQCVLSQSVGKIRGCPTCESRRENELEDG